MSFAPQHDWTAYESQVAKDEVERVRSLGTSERYAIYADMFAVIWTARQNDRKRDWEALDRWSWQEKLAIRQRCAAAYRRLDELRNGRAAANDAG